MWLGFGFSESRERRGRSSWSWLEEEEERERREEIESDSESEEMVVNNGAFSADKDDVVLDVLRWRRFFRVLDEEGCVVVVLVRLGLVW